MCKKIKITDTDLTINTSEILVIEIGMLSFEKDERYCWVDIYGIGNENKEFIEQIDYENMPVLITLEELKIFALNWYFNNVEIVKEVAKC